MPPRALWAEGSPASVYPSSSGALSSTTPTEAPSTSASGFFSSSSSTFPRSFDHRVTPPSSSSSSHRHPQHVPTSSTNISNFPSSLEHRTPEPDEGAHSSPPSSPPNKSAFATPKRRAPQQQSSPSSTMNIASPWLALAATSGAPTPSFEFPPSLAGTRDSPKLGQPFERLNLGGPTVPSAVPTASFFGDELPGPSRVASSPLPLSQASRPMPHVSPSAPPQPNVPSGAVSGLSRPESPMVRSAPVSLAQRRASMPLQSLSLPSFGSAATTPSSPLSASLSSTSRIRPLAPKDFVDLVSSDTTLILDMRPPSSFEASHVVGAQSVSVPSTLLRRPAFGLQKLIHMLPAAVREIVGKWKNMSHIVLIDHDSAIAPDGSVLAGVSSKFEREGFAGKLWFLQGGHVAIKDDDRFEFEAGEHHSDESPPRTQTPGIPSLGRLSRLAFQQGSTTTYTGVPQTAAAVVRENPFKSLSVPPITGPAHESSRGRLQPANPFFDNIRQNLELSHGGITERIPLALPKEQADRADELPPFLRDLVKMPEEESSELLAKQFHRLERGEQERLQSVMDVLSRDNSTEMGGSYVGTHIARSADEVEQLMTAAGDDNKPTGYYPFSITAGVERGTKNRYKNIWPYDFSRVRLGSLADDDSDYINASYVQPRGTTRRYIATQGPLEATYRDFWTVVWEQNVHVIVMLTKQFEGGLLKCGQYWKDEQYGDLQLRLVSQTGGEDKAEGATTGFDFGGAAHPRKTGASTPESNIKRVFKIWHSKTPEQVRTVTQIQCVAWPDFDVPDSPQVLLRLMHDVDETVEAACGCGEDRCQVPPVLVHCSAGIGRTGSYILADAVADGLRRERHRHTVQSHAPPASEMFEPKDATDGSTSSTRSLPRILPTMPRAKSPEKMDLDPPTKPEPPAQALSPGNIEPTPLATPTPASYSSSRDVNRPKAVTQSHRVHRQPTPITSLKEPIMDVLAAMRVQRMSLVQSLRQYLFVHRTLIAYYLDMVDREGTRQSMSDPERASLGSAMSLISTSTAPTSISGGASGSGTMDDEAHFKRKPSCTDLQPEMDARLHSNKIDELRIKDEGSSLAKRLSFKKRRGDRGESA